MKKLYGLWIVLTIVSTGVQGREVIEKAFSEAVLMVPKKNAFFTTYLETTIYKPEGDGPFPIVVINHGKNRGDTRFQARYRPLNAVRYFIERGYLVVVPMRQGFSKSTGSYISTGCNVQSNGDLQAESIRAVLDYITVQSYADKNNIVVVGQSHGGWAALAFGATNYSGMKAVINFAGGLRQDECPSWEGALVRSVGAYAKTTKIPSLWFYGDNDSFFRPFTFHAMYDAFVVNGAHAHLVAYGDFADDAHRMFGSRAGGAIWHAEVSKFLQELHLPHEVISADYVNEKKMGQDSNIEFPGEDRATAH